jgi:hypothetical protein
MQRGKGAKEPPGQAEGKFYDALAMAKQMIRKVRAVSCERTLIIRKNLTHATDHPHVTFLSLRSKFPFVQASEPRVDVQRVRFIVLITKYNRVIFPEAVKHRLFGPVSGSLNLLLERSVWDNKEEDPIPWERGILPQTDRRRQSKRLPDQAFGAELSRSFDSYFICLAFDPLRH